MHLFKSRKHLMNLAHNWSVQCHDYKFGVGGVCVCYKDTKCIECYSECGYVDRYPP